MYRARASVTEVLFFLLLMEIVLGKARVSRESIKVLACATKAMKAKVERNKLIQTRISSGRHTGGWSKFSTMLYLKCSSIVGFHVMLIFNVKKLSFYIKNDM